MKTNNNNNNNNNNNDDHDDEGKGGGGGKKVETDGILQRKVGFLRPICFLQIPLFPCPLLSASGSLRMVAHQNK